MASVSTEIDRDYDHATTERSSRRIGIEIFVVSFVVLFQELALIRWLPAQVRVLAYFPNLILLSAFLGLGLGCLRSRKGSLLWLWPLSLLVLTGTAFGLSHVAFTQNSVSEHLWLLYFDLPKDAPVVDGVKGAMVLCFVLNAVSFVPLGQLLAIRLRALSSRSLALAGYSSDILGSLFGVVGFALASFARATPPLWFGVFLAAGLAFFVGTRRRALAYCAIGGALIALVALADRADFYSPYYAITVRPNPVAAGIEILTNGSLHQYALPLRRDFPANKLHQNIREGYHTPYRLLDHPARRVLVLGAGTGNDVAVALDEGAEHVDAVEIDPVILDLGDLHPDSPYDSPRVRRINTDARTFLSDSKDRYDLIVFGTLDSMTRLSALSNVRLDNFVYTQEGLQAAREHLAPGGGIIMYFMVSADYIDQRLFRMLARVFGDPPAVVSNNYSLFNRIYLAGPAFASLQVEQRRVMSKQLAKNAAGLDLPSDDWPYLYLRGRGISGFYLSMIATFALLGIAAVLLSSVEMRRSILRGGIDVESFLFGLGFLLLETKSVTTMSLLWGATWLTSAIVFAAILVMILAATLLMQWRPLPWWACMVGLSASLLTVHAVPVHAMLSENSATRLAFSLVFVGIPIFFASTGFARIFRDREDTDLAFGWNVLGAVAGGLVEFLSMVTGLRALYLLALTAYLFAALVHLRGRGAIAQT